MLWALILVLTGACSRNAGADGGPPPTRYIAYLQGCPPGWSFEATIDYLTRKMQGWIVLTSTNPADALKQVKESEIDKALVVPEGWKICGNQPVFEDCNVFFGYLDRYAPPPPTWPGWTQAPRAPTEECKAMAKTSAFQFSAPVVFERKRPQPTPTATGR